MIGKKKRMVSLLLVLAMLLITLCACGAQESGGQGSPAPADATAEKQPEAEQKTGQDAVQETAQDTGDAQAGPDISEEVTLVMYLIGDRPVDNDEVFAKINERLKAEINATIEVKFMSWSEYEQKYPLIFCSCEIKK